MRYTLYFAPPLKIGKTRKHDIQVSLIFKSQAEAAGK